jgi:hypothetical protein
MTTDDDTRLLDDLRGMWWRADPPTPGLANVMIAAVAAADLDDEWELLVLVSDSAVGPAAQVRGLSTSRVLYFNAESGWSLEAEIDGDEVRGQLLDLDGDLSSVVIGLETRDGTSWTTELDEVGFFSMRAGAAGSVRFTVRIGRKVATSGWLEV